MRLNKVEGRQLLLSERMPGLKVGTEIFRNHDQAFSKQLEKASSERRIRVDMRLSECDEGIVARTGRRAGDRRRRHAPCDKQPADNPARALQQARDQLGKLGNTLFVARQIELAFTTCLLPPHNSMGCAGTPSPPWRRPVFVPIGDPSDASLCVTSPSPTPPLLPWQRAEQGRRAVLPRPRGGTHRPAYEANQELGR